MQYIFGAILVFCVLAGIAVLDGWMYFFFLGVILVAGVPWELANWNTPQGASNGEDISEG